MERLEDLSSGNKRYRIDLSALITVDAKHDACCGMGCPWLDNYHTLECTLFRSSLWEGCFEDQTYYKRCSKCLEAMLGVVEL